MGCSFGEEVIDVIFCVRKLVMWFVVGEKTQHFQICLLIWEANPGIYMEFLGALQKWE